jgi:DNA-binding transcriptional ArsR family regulator
VPGGVTVSGAGGVLVEFDPEHTPVQVTVDPMLTVLTSIVELLALTDRLPPQLRAKGRSLARRVDLDALGPLWRVAESSNTIPDRLTHSGLPGVWSYAEQLERMRSLSADDVLASFAESYPDGAPRYLRDWIEHPVTSLHRYLAAVDGFRREVVDPLYPNIYDRLRRAAESLVIALNSAPLHPVMLGTDLVESVTPQMFRAHSNWPSNPDPLAVRRIELRFVVADRRTIVSNLFPWTEGRAPVDGAVLLSYATNTTTLAVDRYPARDGLAAVLTPSRAVILRSLTTPHTTTGLANALGLAPSTVSHHLRALRSAGLVTSTRQGSGVASALTERGHGLLRLFADDERATAVIL